MRPRRLRSNAGFTYIAVLVMVMIVGFLAAQGALVWKTRMQREKETELIFRGRQIRDAMRLYYGMATDVTMQNTAATGGGQAGRVNKPQTIPPNAPMLNELKDLLQAPSSAGKKRYLRKLYLDPMTGNDFALIKDPATNRYIGVASTSEAEPIKKDFEHDISVSDLEPGDFQDKKKYSEWQFICTHYPKPAIGSGVTNPNGSGSPGGSDRSGSGSGTNAGSSSGGSGTNGRMQQVPPPPP
jgi:type II secretory pathway pseudopilin PulG